MTQYAGCSYCHAGTFVHSIECCNQLHFLCGTGTIYAAGISAQAITALRITGSSITFLTSQNLASAHVNGAQLRIRTRDLKGLNGSVITAAAFDEHLQQRAYAVTADLELLLLQVPDPGTREAKVWVKANPTIRIRLLTHLNSSNNVAAAPDEHLQQKAYAVRLTRNYFFFKPLTQAGSGMGQS